MSTLVLEHLKHTNASSNNITLAADGSLTLAGNTSVTGNLTVDTDTLVVDASNNTVGILNTAPGNYLDGELTIGNSTKDQYVNIVTGSANAAGLCFQDTTGTSIISGLRYTHGDNKLAFWGNGAERMSITSEGYVKQPNRPFFFAYPGEGTGGHNATSEWTSGMGTHYDNGSNYSGARFTAPVTGYYFFIAWFQEETYYGSWNSPISLQWYKNGSVQFSYGVDNPGIPDAYSEMNIGNSVITYLAENDTFSAAVRTPNGSPSTEYNSGGVQGWLIS